MNLKNNKITLGELLDYAPAQAVLRKRFPMALRHPLVGAARTVTLEQLLAFAGDRVPQKKLDETISDLQKA